MDSLIDVKNTYEADDNAYYDEIEDEDSGNVTGSDISSSQEDISLNLIAAPPILNQNRFHGKQNNSDSQKKRVLFKTVDVYYFERTQGFSCVPNQGGSTLGMKCRHYRKERFSIRIFHKNRKHEKNAILFNLCLDGVLSLTSEQYNYLKDKLKSSSCLSDGFSSYNCDRLDENACESKEDGEVSLSSSSLNSFNSDCIDPNNFSIPGESDSEEELESLRTVADSYFLQPMSIKKRRVFLKNTGVPRIDSSEKQECQDIRDSRLLCGCNCKDKCEPETCICALNGIPCQVDRSAFPCACSSPAFCENVNGRIKFDPVRARTHYLHTRMRLEMEQTKESESYPKYPVVENEETSDPPKCHPLKRIKPCDDTNSESGASTKSIRLCDDSKFEHEDNEAFLALYNTTIRGGCRDCQNSRYVNVLMHELSNQQRNNRLMLSMDSGSFANGSNYDGYILNSSSYPETSNGFTSANQCRNDGSLTYHNDDWTPLNNNYIGTSYVDFDRYSVSKVNKDHTYVTEVINEPVLTREDLNKESHPATSTDHHYYLESSSYFNGDQSATCSQVGLHSERVKATSSVDCQFSSQVFDTNPDLTNSIKKSTSHLALETFSPNLYGNSNENHAGVEFEGKCQNKTNLYCRLEPIASLLSTPPVIVNDSSCHNESLVTTEECPMNSNNCNSNILSTPTSTVSA